MNTVPDLGSNQPPPLVGYDPFECDPVLRDALLRGQSAWAAGEVRSLGQIVASERVQTLADQANRHTPILRTMDRYGNRCDLIEYHPAYHELMSLAFAHGLHSVAWTAQREGAFTARAALNYLWNGVENGTACPVTMTFAAVHVLRTHGAVIAPTWLPKLTANAYDPRPLVISEKSGATVGMTMTERQGGSDLRTNTVQARAQSDGIYALDGAKWFCSAPMSDAFLALARTSGGLSCFFVPRRLVDRVSNGIEIQRLKDKCGNRSNASAEIEYREAFAWRFGEEGKGISTLIEMAHLTRFDIVVAIAGMMRGMLVQVLHHCKHRKAFGRALIEQPLMCNVLADLCLEWEAGSLLAFRLALAFDRALYDPTERLLTRVLTPVAKYWLAKRNPTFAAEAMECLGGNGYTEDWPLARFYREAPLNGIWEGSGNVICLDALRAIRNEPAALDALILELKPIMRLESRLAAWMNLLQHELADTEHLEERARFIVEGLAVAFQAGLLLQHAPAPVADAFCASRLTNSSGSAFGTLPSAASAADIVAHAWTE